MMNNLVKTFKENVERKKLKPYVHLVVKGKYFKHALSLFKEVDVGLLAWITACKECFVFFTRDDYFDDIELTPFDWGDMLYVLCIYPFTDGYKDVSITLPVIVREWALGDSSLTIPSNVVKQLIRVIPDDNLLIDFCVYANWKLGYKGYDIVVLRSDEFSALLPLK